MEDDAFIPAAHVQDVDLTRADPAIAAEIQRLGTLMERGDETPEQFAQLVRLLHQGGFRPKGEYLLRRNIEVVEDGPSLYRELYGTAKPEEFAAAIDAFAEQFSLTLELLEERDFLESVYRTTPTQARLDDLRLLSEPCEVRFDYASQDAVETDVCSLTDDECVILRWVNGVWEATDESSE